MKWNKNTKSTLAGYLVAVYNASIMLDVDNLDWTLVSTYLKIFGAVILPIIGGHTTEIKTTDSTPTPTL